MSQTLPTLGSTIRSQRGQALPALGIAIGSQDLVLGTPMKDEKLASASKSATDICKPIGRLPKVGAGHPRGQPLVRRAQPMGQALPALGIAIGIEEVVRGKTIRHEKGANAC